MLPDMAQGVEPRLDLEFVRLVGRNLRRRCVLVYRLHGYNDTPRTAVPVSENDFRIVPEL